MARTKHGLVDLRPSLLQFFGRDKNKRKKGKKYFVLHNYTHDLIPQIKSKLLPGEDRNLVYVGYCFLLVTEQVSKYPAIEFGIYLDTLIV